MRPKEIVVRLSSGLGNQLFQFTQGVALAEKTGSNLRFDTTWFQFVAGLHPVRRQLRLPQFQLQMCEAFGGLRRLAIGIAAGIFDKTAKGETLLAALGRMQVLQENSEFTEAQTSSRGVKQDADRIYLNGYWQTSGPFLQVSEKLLPQLKPRSPISSDAKSLIAKVRSKGSGFIHVRRGDYMHFLGEEGMLSAEYYSRAFSAMRASGNKVSHWLIFSEDAEWVRSNLGFISNAEVVDYQSPNRDIEDLMVMRECVAGIIANSSYSWWGAALGERADRAIITPDRYWKHSSRLVSSWALPRWTQVRAWD